MKITLTDYEVREYLEHYIRELLPEIHGLFDDMEVANEGQSIVIREKPKQSESGW